MNSPGERDSRRKRASNACVRCRRHKIKCSGSQPCETCTRRQIRCIFDEKHRMSAVEVRELQRRLVAVEQRLPVAHPPPVSSELEDDTINVDDPTRQHPRDLHASEASPDARSEHSQRSASRISNRDGEISRETSQGDADAPPQHSPLVNTLAMSPPFYVFDASGKGIYLGTSSNWSFGRRVLHVAQERILKTPLPPQGLLWEGKAYDLGWDGTHSINAVPPQVLPQADYGIYLINAVKFYVGQLFHLFDETVFMENFAKFYDNSPSSLSSGSLWYRHYLLIIAFGKAFVARDKIKEDQKPPGSAFFLEAMANMPDLDFYSSDPFETIEVLCCVALYLHCLEFRAAAYKTIGRALRTAFEYGLHTDMQHYHFPPEKLERGRRIFWTTLLLDNQFTALMGLPVATQEADIGAKLPSFNCSAHKALALEMHVKLMSAMAQIVSKVYGLNNDFLAHAKSALRSVAKVTDQLKESFPLCLDDSATGISRVSAYLHILQHQCILVATRPVLFHYFELRLAHEDEPPRKISIPKNIWTLLTLCKGSALEMMHIILSLQKQGLLERFLPFDLDALCNSAIVLVMAAYIDAPLFEDHQPVVASIHNLLSSISSQGNRIATMVQVELERLESLLATLPHRSHRLASQSNPDLTTDATNVADRSSLANADMASTQAYNGESNLDWFCENSIWQEMNAENIMGIANSIDLNGMEWSLSRNGNTAALDPA